MLMVDPIGSSFSTSFVEGLSSKTDENHQPCRDARCSRRTGRVLRNVKSTQGPASHEAPEPDSHHPARRGRNSCTIRSGHEDAIA